MSAEAGPPATAASLYDIGYRHYDGRRMGRPYIRRALYSQSLRGTYGLGRSARSKVLPMILFGVMCVPALIIDAVTVYTHLAKLPIQYTAYAVFLQPVIGLFLAGQAPQAVSRDLRFKTVPLYFSRPLERLDYVVAKFAAMASALFLLTAVPLLILWIGALLAKLDFWKQAEGLGQGLVSVALLSLLFGGIGLVLAALTPRRGFGVAAVIAVMVISYGAVSALQGIAAAQGAAALSGWLGLFSPMTLVVGVQASFLGAHTPFAGGHGPASGSGPFYLVVLLGLVAATFGLLMRRYRKVGMG